MIKTVFLLRSGAAEKADSFRRRVLDGFIHNIPADSPELLKITLTAADPPRLSITPYRKDRIALVALWESNRAKAGRWPQIVEKAWDGPCQGYLVEESSPLSYKRTWPAGCQTPGLGLLTLFRARRGISHDDFITMWHRGHTPLGMSVHPLWNYVRNVVVEGVIPDSPDLGGIVEEHCRTSGDLLNPVRFFGGPLKMVPNMVRIGLDITKWMDLGSIENYLVTEHWIRD